MLRFDASNWNTPQTVYVKAVEDHVATGTQFVAISQSVQSDDPNFNRAIVRNVLVQVLDDNQAGLIITESDGSTEVLEGNAPQGIVDSYTVSLSKQPTADVTVSLAQPAGQVDGRIYLTNGPDPLSTQISSLTFSPADWSTPQTVYVHARDDGQKENTAIVKIVHSVTSNDPAYAALVGTQTVNVTVLDTNSPGVLFTQTDQSTTVVKGGAGDSYTMRLTSAPRARSPWTFCRTTRSCSTRCRARGSTFRPRSISLTRRRTRDLPTRFSCRATPSRTVTRSFTGWPAALAPGRTGRWLVLLRHSRRQLAGGLFPAGRHAG